MEKVAAATRSAPPAVPIVAGVVAQHDVPIYLSGVGTVIAYNTDVVRAQIQGQIISINFTEGQAVHAGDLLAQIDPRPYQALIEQYTGNLERDQAQLINAQANLTRYNKLGDKGWATPQLVETQKAQVGQLQAAIKTDQALIDAAKVELSFTRLTSPIDGVAGIRQIDVGNIISPSTTNGLVVVTQLNPISLIFTLPETDLPQIQQQQQKTNDAARRFLPTARMIRSSWVKACSASSTTRSCRRRARSSSRRIFPTSSHQLWPGELVNARLLVDTRHNGLTVPASVVQQGPNGALRLRRQSRQHRGDPPRQGRANQRRPGADRFRPQGQRDRSWSTDNTSCNPARVSRCCTARRRRKPLHKARSRRQSHEHFRTIHPSADRNRPADGRTAGRRPRQLSAVAGGGAAERQLSDPSDHGPAAGRRSADHGVFGGDAARIAVRRDPGPQRR